MDLEAAAAAWCILEVVGAAAARAQETPPDLEARVKALEERLGAKNSLQAVWKDGLRFESPTKEFEIRIGGRIQFDSMWGEADRDAEAAIGSAVEDGAEMRRARLYLAGRLYEKIDFRWEYEFADQDGKTKFVDVYAGLVELDCFPDLRAGHFREPFGLDALSGATELPCMERALPFALAPFRNLGIQLSDACAGERVTAAAGVFRESSDQAIGQADGAYAATARVTGVPWFADEGRRLVHLGVAASRRAPPDDEVQYRSKPESNLAPVFVDTGVLTDVETVTLLGGEAALLLGRCSLQAEYASAELRRTAGFDRARFSGWQALATWTITGEPRRYRFATGVFQAPQPAADAFDRAGGCGAWEVAARVSALDLDDGVVAGGELVDHTLGLNWYLNRSTRVQLNAIHSRLDRGASDGSANILEMRVQLSL